MLNRLQATRYIVQHVTDEPIIASLGNPKFDLFTAQDRPRISTCGILWVWRRPWDWA